ncbi:Hypothetical protein A7982_07265 [Minicystis rosea]|nr:Hypothetical protein A7982_07265 [Minicystis rosea]
MRTDFELRIIKRLRAWLGIEHRVFPPSWLFAQTDVYRTRSIVSVDATLARLVGPPRRRRDADEAIDETPPREASTWLDDVGEAISAESTEIGKRLGEMLTKVTTMVRGAGRDTSREPDPPTSSRTTTPSSTISRRGFARWNARPTRGAELLDARASCVSPLRSRRRRRLPHGFRRSRLRSYELTAEARPTAIEAP